MSSPADILSEAGIEVPVAVVEVGDPLNIVGDKYAHIMRLAAALIAVCKLAAEQHKFISEFIWGEDNPHDYETLSSQLAIVTGERDELKKRNCSQCIHAGHCAGHLPWQHGWSGPREVTFCSCWESE